MEKKNEVEKWRDRLTKTFGGGYKATMIV